MTGSSTAAGNSQSVTAIVTVVVPTLNEAAGIHESISLLASPVTRVVVSDGGSKDDTVAIARRAGATVVTTAPGRASQMNAGANEALAANPRPQWLLFLHADVRLPQITTNDAQPDRARLRNAGCIALAMSRCASTRWGHFDVRLIADTTTPFAARVALAVVGRMMNWRSALTGICTGDQGLLVHSALFEQVGGFEPIALMEDISMSRRLKKAAGYPARLGGPLAVSARRWQRDGIAQTIISMWWFRLRYFLGVSPDRLHREYYRH